MLGLLFGAPHLAQLCVAWRQTGGCDPLGPREQHSDRACSSVVPRGQSGYCECRGGPWKQVRLSTCEHEPFTCTVACQENANDRTGWLIVLVVIVIDHIFELARFLLGTALPFFFRIAFDFARFCGWPNVLALACVILSAWWIHRRLAPAPAPAPPPALPPSPSPPPASYSTASPLDVLRADFQSHFGIPAGYFSPGFDYDYGTDTRTEDSVARGSLGDEFDLRLLRGEKWRKLGLDISRYGPDEGWLDKKLGWTAVFHGTTTADGTLNSIIQHGLRTPTTPGSPAQIRNANVHGPGVYCSPSLWMAKLFCAPPRGQLWNGKHVVFFCRARPYTLQRPTSDIRVVPNDADIRLVAVLVGPYP